MSSVNSASDSFKRRATAAARVFCEYGDFIRETIRIYVQDEEQVDELAQAFFISLVGKPIPEPVQNIEGYLYRALINDIADADRLTRRYQGLLRTYAELSRYPEEQKTPYELLVREEESRIILDLVQGRLPHSEAKAVILRFREHRSVPEAAEKMGVESLTLKGYVCQGLSRIRRLLRNIEAEVAD